MGGSLKQTTTPSAGRENRNVLIKTDKIRLGMRYWLPNTGNGFSGNELYKYIQMVMVIKNLYTFYYNLKKKFTLQHPL